MDADRWERIDQLFAEAREEPPDEQAAFLRSHCDDRAVRAEVASLLDAREEAPAFFEAAAEQVVAPALAEFEGTGVPDGSERTALDLAGQRVAAYRLVEEIGVGGMSVVYRAERVRGDYERTVAVKLLQRRFQTEAVEERFRAERQVLASLSHPNIAQLIDGGVTEGGRPYLVMEHVDGVPLTTYVDQHDLGLEARLDLLVQVFEAVQAAHRQLVVHRDLKPSNVLVTETDTGEPQVKLLDFGIAKLLGEALPVPRPETRTGRPLMTPAYAAPEQVAGEEITTATDVYQLGVLAYEMLSGDRPFDLADKNLTEIERILLEDEPQTPSEAADHFADRLRGDLDTILLKALRKEPGRRYQSVEALASDLGRYRAGEPVQARPTTLWYRTRKFAARHRTAVAAGIVIALLGVAYAATVTVQANRLAEQRNRAQTEAETADQVSAYLVDLFQSGDPMGTDEQVPSAVDLLDRGIDRIQQFDDRPLVQARMLDALGKAATGLGRWNQAASLLERSLSLRRTHLDAPHPDLVASLLHLGTVFREETDYAKAKPFYDEALEMSRALGKTAHHTDILEGMAHTLAEVGSPDSAATLARRAVASRDRTQGGKTTRSPLDQIDLAKILFHGSEQQDEAKSLYRRGINRLEEDSNAYSTTQRARIRSNFAYFLNQAGDYEDAEKYARKAVPMNRRTHGQAHYTTRRARTHLYAALVQQAKYEQALAVRRTQLDVAREQYDPPHYRLAVQHTVMGRVLDNLGRSEEALPLLRTGMEMMEADAGPENLWTHFTRIPYALCLIHEAQLDRADALLDRVEPVVKNTHPDSTTLGLSRMTAEIAIGRGEIQAHRENWAAAESLLTDGYRRFRTEGSVYAPLTQRALRSLVNLHERAGRAERAAAYEDSLALPLKRTVRRKNSTAAGGV